MTPFKSEAQRRKFQALKKKGKVSQKTIDEWESKTPKNIPERVKKKSKQKTATRPIVKKHTKHATVKKGK